MYEVGDVSFIGIDPGKAGGIATITGREVTAYKMPDTERDLWTLILRLSCAVQTSFAVIEAVHAMPKQGVSSTFKFGKGFGNLRMALIAADVPFEDATPQKWMKALSIPKRAKTDTTREWKNKLKAKAQELFQQIDVTLGTSDALLIAFYCRLRHFESQKED